jgi:predicted O-linked N-acetylglucosamine transferase (SPINDLY family)
VVNATEQRQAARQFAEALEHHKAGRLAEAERLYRVLHRADPNHAATLHRLGVVAHQLGRSDAAEILQRAAALRPEHAEIHNDLGVVLGSQGRFAEAAACFARAASVRPDYAEAHNNLAGALRRLGRIEEACVHFRRVADLAPNSGGARNNLGTALLQIGEPDQALAQFDQAVVLAPDFAPARYNRGLALRRLGRISEARADFDKTATLQPDFTAAKLAACMAQLLILYEDESEIARQRAAYETSLRALADEIARADAPGRLADMIGAHQPFYLAYQGQNDRALQALYGTSVCRIMAARYGAAPLASPPAPDEPVRVAIVSGFFKQHSNWKIPIKGWLGQLDRKRFRLYGYYTGIESDAATAEAAARCQRFVRGPLSAEAWRHAITADAPHVIIYPEVGMDPIAAQLAAQRLAPLQCNTWGHPDTSGFPTLDYYLSSDLMEPPDCQDHYTEQLIRLPNLSIYYEPAEAVAAPCDRATLGLRPDAFVFWCGQSLPKYLPQFDQVFARIAQAVGNCQFTFIRFPGGPHVTELFEQRLRRAFAAFDLRVADYCVFLPRLEPHDFVAAIGACDAVLDSIGWSGCNSILESLAHNLPIVTFPGQLMRGRHAAAILTMMDVRETIAASVDEYIAMATRVARDPAWRAELRRKIADNKKRLYRDRTCIAALEDFLEMQVRGAPAQR